MDNNFEQKHRLSDIQTQVLLLAFSAPTAVIAQATIQTNDKTVAAGETLEKMGLIATTSNGIIVTDNGVTTLDSINVLDKLGRRTPYGEEQFNKGVELTSGSDKQFESAWPLLSSISQLV